MTRLVPMKSGIEYDLLTKKGRAVHDPKAGVRSEVKRAFRRRERRNKLAFAMNVVAGESLATQDTRNDRNAGHLSQFSSFSNCRCGCDREDCDE